MLKLSSQEMKMLRLTAGTAMTLLQANIVIAGIFARGARR